MVDQHGQPLPDWLVPARKYEGNFTLADLNVIREFGAPRARALVAVIDGLVAALPRVE